MGVIRLDFGCRRATVDVVSRAAGSGPDGQAHGHARRPASLRFIPLAIARPGNRLAARNVPTTSRRDARPWPIGSGSGRTQRRKPNQQLRRGGEHERLQFPKSDSIQNHRSVGGCRGFPRIVRNDGFGVDQYFSDDRSRTSCVDPTGRPAPAPGMFISSEVARETPRADPQRVAATVDADTQFALDIFAELRAAENLMISPYSIASALTMAYAGAAGTTADEMADVLHLTGDPADAHLGRNLLERSLTAARRDR